MTKDFLKEWDDNLAKIDVILKEFQAQYGTLPGIIEMNADDWFGASFTVLFDNKTFQPGSLPEKYDVFDVVEFDVYDQRDQLLKTISMLEPQIPAGIKSTAMEFFYTQVRKLDEVIDRYEKKDNPK